MKLLEQQRAPINVWLRRDGRLQHALQGLSQIRLPQQTLKAAVVALLVGPAGGTAAVQLQVELVAPDRQALAQGLELLQIGPQSSMALGAG